MFAAACNAKSDKPNISGQIIDPDSEIGHMMRDNKFPAALTGSSKDIVIIGGGISGLSAARWLKKNGITEFTLLELSSEVGGNSISGQNIIGAYPWAAHYLPIPNNDCVHIIEFLKENNIITSIENNIPHYNEKYLCSEPQERLLIHGKWQDGLIPDFGLAKSDRLELARFHATVEELKFKKGSDEKYAFAIPTDESSADKEYRLLDAITMVEYLELENYSSEYLRWYINYCCLDDYGTAASETSAWAGLHYFASRRGTAGNSEEGSVLTWPEGNAFLATLLKNPIKDNIQTGCVVFKVVKISDEQHEIHYYDQLKKQSFTLTAKKVISALPQFVNGRIFSNYKLNPIDSFTYCPWITANITVSGWPAGNDRPLSWDNVQYGSSSLGYVNAGHQLMKINATATVLTWYCPISDPDTKSARNNLRTKSYEELKQLVLTDLLKMHKDCEQYIERIDIRVWGHAMIRPTKNFIWGSEREAAAATNASSLAFAHSDLSGISIFEEAFLRGIKGANQILTAK